MGVFAAACAPVGDAGEGLPDTTSDEARTAYAALIGRWEMAREDPQHSHIVNVIFQRDALRTYRYMLVRNFVDDPRAWNAEWERGTFALVTRRNVRTIVLTPEGAGAPHAFVYRFANDRLVLSPQWTPTPVPNPTREVRERPDDELAPACEPLSDVALRGRFEANAPYRFGGSILQDGTIDDLNGDQEPETVWVSLDPRYSGTNARRWVFFSGTCRRFAGQFDGVGLARGAASHNEVRDVVVTANAGSRGSVATTYQFDAERREFVPAPTASR
jgi:hypothetical protein